MLEVQNTVDEPINADLTPWNRDTLINRTLSLGPKQLTLESSNPWKKVLDNQDTLRQSQKWLHLWVPLLPSHMLLLCSRQKIWSYSIPKYIVLKGTRIALLYYLCLIFLVLYISCWILFKKSYLYVRYRVHFNICMSSQ